jgi:hypothetical protein
VEERRPRPQIDEVREAMREHDAREDEDRPRPDEEPEEGDEAGDGPPA